MTALAAHSDVPSLVTASNVENALRDIEPVELRSPLIRRVGASGFVTEDILSRAHARLARERVDATSVLLDAGCGRGGPGLWLAEQTGARLYGIDVDAYAIDQALRSARGYKLLREPHFACASYETTWIEPETAHVVFSLDALHLAARPLEALAELHRIMIEGGVLLFNVYVAAGDADAQTWVQNLETSGFTILDIDDQTRRWREVMMAKHRARIEHAAFLTRRFGTRVAGELASSRALLGLDYGPSVIAGTRRVELFARKLPSHTPRRRLAHGSVQTLCMPDSRASEQDRIAMAVEDDLIDRLGE
ncbi:MAG TPA: class I SAM-dependent methyltransferase [Kofleriaceae bacterium]